MLLFFTCLTNNSNLQKSEFDYFKTTNVGMSHSHRNCILQQDMHERPQVYQFQSKLLWKGARYLFHIFARETNDPS